MAAVIFHREEVPILAVKKEYEGERNRDQVDTNSGSISAHRKGPSR